MPELGELLLHLGQRLGHASQRRNVLLQLMKVCNQTGSDTTNLRLDLGMHNIVNLGQRRDDIIVLVQFTLPAFDDFNTTMGTFVASSAQGTGSYKGPPTSAPTS